MLASFCSLRRLLAPQNISHVKPLVGGKTLASAKEIQEGVSVFQEDGGKLLGCFSHHHSCSMASVGTRTMIEQHSRTRSVSGWPPKERLEAEIPTRNRHGLRSGRTSNLHN